MPFLFVMRLLAGLVEAQQSSTLAVEKPLAATHTKNTVPFNIKWLMMAWLPSNPISKFFSSDAFLLPNFPSNLLSLHQHHHQTLSSSINITTIIKHCHRQTSKTYKIILCHHSQWPLPIIRRLPASG
jgi:hypothetical protein